MELIAKICQFVISDVIRIGLLGVHRDGTLRKCIRVSATSTMLLLCALKMPNTASRILGDGPENEG